MTPPPSPLTLSLAVAVALAALVGCADPAPALVCEPNADGSNALLVDHDLWVLATPDEDPFAADRPADDISCPPDDRLAEEFAGTYSYAVTTTGCPYTTVTQPSLRDACAGETLYVWLWHFELTAPDPGSAHLAVEIGGDLVWSKTLPIPGPSGLIADEIMLPTDVPTGTPITFHLRNHGSNSYNLLEISVKR